MLKAIFAMPLYMVARALIFFHYEKTVEYRKPFLRCSIDTRPGFHNTNLGSMSSTSHDNPKIER